MTRNEMTPGELKKLLDNKTDLQLIDVREPEEVAICNLGGICIPLGELTMRHHELDSERLCVVLCHHGVRSARATAYLRSLGFTDVRNLAGGIHRWAIEVDPAMPRY